MRRVMGLGIALAVLAGTFSVAFSVGIVTGNSPETSSTGTPHAPIRINSNADFAGVATAGNGSAGNPWVIENHDIDGATAGNCLYIGNTTDFFVIRNCLMWNSSGLVTQPYISDAGIVLYNVQNGHLMNNTVRDIVGNSGADGGDAAGICLVSSDNNILENNTIYNITGGNNSPSGSAGTGWGISMDDGSDDNQVFGNVISNIWAGGVEYFKDGAEDGSSKWTHSSTLANINGECPLEYYNEPVLDTDILSGWNTTDSVGIVGTNITFHSYNESYYIEEPAAGNSDKCAVSDIVNFTALDSAILSFWCKYNLTADENGVFLQVGYNESGSWKWQYVEPPGSYTGNLNSTQYVFDSLGTRIYWCWNGISGAGGYTWNYTELDILTEVPVDSRNQVRIKFNYTQFGGGSGDGWYVDDVRLVASRQDGAPIEPDSKDLWQRVSTTAHGGNYCWSNVDPTTGDLRGGIDNSLTSVPIDLTSATGANLTAYLRFNINEDAGLPPDGFRVEVSIDVGTTWQAINLGVRAGWNVSGTGSDGDDGNASDGKTWSGFTDTGNAIADDYWVDIATLSRMNVNLTAFCGNVIQIRFRVVTSNNASYDHNNNLNSPDPGFGGFYLDDIEVRATPPTPVSDGRGIGIRDSTDNTVTLNNISQCFYGAHLSGLCFNNLLYHNNFINNIDQAFDDAANLWDSGWVTGGNYWSDYSGVDNCHGPNQDIAGSDGFGDSGYSISGGPNVDRYPLMAAYDGQDLGEAVPPIALGHFPSGSDVEDDSVIWIEWNETMNWTSVEDAFSYTDGVTVFDSTHGNWSHDSMTNVSTFTPADDFEYETRYDVTVNCTATDVTGNALDQDNNSVGGEWPLDVLEWNFTTTDQAPMIISTIPAHNQIEVPPDTIIKLIFTEEMNTTSVEGAFSYYNATQTWTAADGFEYWEDGNTSFIYVPLVDLENNMTYTVHVNGSAAKDAGGKPMGNNYSWVFKTWSEPPLPHVIDVDPADGATGVSINIHLNVEFDVAMDVSSTEAAFSYTDGTEVWGPDDGDFLWSENNASFSFTPSSFLSHDTTYFVTVDGTASSTYGRTLDGDGDGVISVDDDYTFTFTTALAPPRVIWTNPEEAETDVRIDIPAILIHFNTVMDTASVDVALTITPEVNHTMIWRPDNFNLTVRLDEDLEEGGYYVVRILATATDLYGTKLDGNGDGVGGDNFVLSFVTEGANISAAPYVDSVFPPPGNTTIPVDTFVGISFSTAMNRTNTEGAFSFTNASGPVNGTFVWSAAKTMKFIPSKQLAYNTTYFVTITTGATDRDGLALEESFSWQFTTEGEGEEEYAGTNWILISIIVILLIVICAQYLRGRGLQYQLRRARVEINKLKSAKGTEPETEPQKDDYNEVEPPTEPDEPSTTNEEGVPRQ